MSRISTRWWMIVLLMVALGLAACTDQDSEETDETPAPTPTVESGVLPPNTGPDLDTGLGLPEPVEIEGPASGLPGCSDPNAEDCPVPLDVELDGEASAGGVTIAYPARYFDAATNPDAADGEPLITITPSERNKFAFKGTFTVYFAESVEAALAELDAPEIADWSVDTLTGKVGVSHDETLDPPVTTAVGAFDTADGRVVVLKAVTTGDYGWDFHVITYEHMLAGLVVAE